MSYRYDAFISYSSNDQELVEYIVEKLITSGLKVWYDRFEIRPGDHILNKVNEGLSDSSKVISFWSRSYFSDSKHWTLGESFSFQIDDLLARTRSIIPVVIDSECQPPPTFRSLAYLDLSDSLVLDKNIPRIIDAVKDRLIGNSSDTISQRPSHSFRTFDLQEDNHYWNFKLTNGHCVYKYYSISKLIDKVLQSFSGSKVIVKGVPGVGKTTFLKVVNDYLRSLGQRVVYIELLGVNSIEEVARDMLNCQEFILLLDGLEDCVDSSSECGTNVNKYFNGVMKLNNSVFLTMRGSTYKEMFDEFAPDNALVIDIEEWESSQLENYLAYHNAKLPSREFVEILSVPFYANIYGNLQKDKGFELTDHYGLIDAFISKEVAKLSRKHSVNKYLLYDLLITLAWRIRRRNRGLTEYEILDVCENRIRGLCNSGLISLLSHRGNGFGFTHDLITEYLVASNIIKSLYNNEFECLSEFQTSYQEDMFIACQLRSDDSTIQILLSENEHSQNDIYSVNIVGILSKINKMCYLRELIQYVRANPNVYEKYRCAVYNRLSTGNSRASPNEKEEKAYKVNMENYIVDEINNGTDPLAAYICMMELGANISPNLVEKYSNKFGINPFEN